MAKNRIILKTHGINNSREVGLVILPESFYVRVNIEVNGDFEVEFFNSLEEQLFSVFHKVNVTINRTPTDDELKEAAKRTAHYIADSLAEYLLDDTKAAYNTVAHLSEWSAQMASIFVDYKVLHTSQSEEDKAHGISDSVAVHASNNNN